MNGAIPNQQQYPTQSVEQQPPTPINGSKNKVGLEILFIVIIIILLSGVLNYFNILKLSEIFPNYLAWLPRKEVPNGTSQSNNVTVSPNNQAKQTLVSFLPSILSPSLLPKSSSEITLNEDKKLGTTLMPHGLQRKE